MRLTLLALAIVAMVPSVGSTAVDCSSDRGILITREMIRCAQQADAGKKDAVVTETVDFLLTLGGGLGKGVERPPPQRLRVPVAYLDPLNPTAKVSGGAIEAGSVELHVPKAGSADTRAIGISITAVGWQDRVRAGTDPDHGGRPGYKKVPTADSGLQALVFEDPARPPNPFERIYLANDPQLGFIQVRCHGIPERGPRNCRVTSELTPFLTVSVSVPETGLNTWRSELLAAHDIAKALIP